MQPRISSLGVRTRVEPVEMNESALISYNVSRSALSVAYWCEREEKRVEKGRLLTQLVALFDGSGIDDFNNWARHRLVVKT